MATTFTADTLRPAIKPAFYFIGVTTGSSSIRTVFPRWAEELELGDVELVGIDLPLHAPAEQYRRVVSFLKEDPLSRGALVTTHKIDLFRAAADLFDEIDPLASLMSEVSCLAKRDGRLVASAKDPYSSGLAIDAFAPPEYWASGDRELFLMGAGGSAIAIDWHLCRRERGAARPVRVTVSNRSAPRLETVERVHSSVAPDIPLSTVVVPAPEDNDRLLASMSPGALVVNATGLGKDAPGSPLTGAARFPPRAIVWDLNYRGDLLFLDQARGQEEARGLSVVDGWEYFLHGWTQVIAEVFDVAIPTSGPEFEALAGIATSARG